MLYGSVVECMYITTSVTYSIKHEYKRGIQKWDSVNNQWSISILITLTCNLKKYISGKCFDTTWSKAHLVGHSYVIPSAIQDTVGDYLQGYNHDQLLLNKGNQLKFTKVQFVNINSVEGPEHCYLPVNFSVPWSSFVVPSTSVQPG